MVRTLAHLSDLHFGREGASQAASALVEGMLRSGIDHVLVSGDVTHNGFRSEAAAFERVFAPLLDRGRLLVVPGNHDRLGDDLHGRFMSERVQVDLRSGACFVRVDTTGPHNRHRISGHGMLTSHDLEAVDHALAEAPRGALRVVLMHHHPLPLPEEMLLERMASWFRRPWAAELGEGRRLLTRIRERCDLVLHGHRHVPSAMIIGGVRNHTLRVFNAGSSTLIRATRVFAHDGNRLMGFKCLHADDRMAPDLTATRLLHLTA